MQDLAKILQPAAPADPNVLVSLLVPDDGAVVKIDNERALVATVDFCPPMVDDAYLFGAISATSALSDIYAMGGTVAFALNICLFPEVDPVEFPLEWVTEALRGGAEKVREAGGNSLGGHTMRNPQPAFGLAVTGFVGLDSIVTLGKARPGQRIILTKALGTGLYIRALRDSLLTLKQASCAVDQMLTLNRAAGAAAVSSGIQAGTDVTGFGLLGHLSEVMAASRTGALIRVSHVPTLPRAHEFAAIGLSTSNTEPNWWAVRDRVVAHYALAERDRLVLSSPETSGGLLLFADPEQLRIFTGEAAGRFSFTVIGEVTEGSTIELAR